MGMKISICGILSVLALFDGLAAAVYVRPARPARFHACAGADMAPIMEEPLNTDGGAASKERMSSAHVELLRVREVATKQLIQAAMTGADHLTIVSAGVKKAAELAVRGIDEIDDSTLD